MDLIRIQIPETERAAGEYWISSHSKQQWYDASIRGQLLLNAVIPKINVHELYVNKVELVKAEGKKEESQLV